MQCYAMECNAMQGDAMQENGMQEHSPVLQSNCYCFSHHCVVGGAEAIPHLVSSYQPVEAGRKSKTFLPRTNCFLVEIDGGADNICFCFLLEPLSRFQGSAAGELEAKVKQASVEM